MLSEEDDEAHRAYDVAASFAGSLSTTASKSPPVSRRTLSGLQQRPDNSQEDHNPQPAPEDLAAKFDAHDMMAYYGDPADETPHIKPSRTITGEFRLAAPGGFLSSEPAPDARRRGASLVIRSRRANHHRGPSRARVTRWLPSTAAAARPPPGRPRNNADRPTRRD